MSIINVHHWRKNQWNKNSDVNINNQDIWCHSFVTKVHPSQGQGKT